MSRHLLTGILLTLYFAMSANAAQVPQPSPVDPRIRTIVYNPREVITLTGQLGYQMVIAFGDSERIENISIGDGQAWQVTPNRKADLLFLKPIDQLPSTNMTVVTNLRRYNFELIATSPTNRRAQTYDIRFVFPHDEIAAVAAAAKPEPVSDATPPESWNFAYSYAGAKTNVPARVFDDGKSTFFQWLVGNEAPAVFVVGQDGNESLVNTAMRGRYFVVDEVAGQFVLRNGAQVTQVFNDALARAQPGAASPREREVPKSKSLFGSGSPP